MKLFCCLWLHSKYFDSLERGRDEQHTVLSYCPSGDNTFESAPIYMDDLRQFRTMNLNSNWLKDMRMELFRRMYEQPIHPKDLVLHQPPGSHNEVDEIYRANIERLTARGTYTLPAPACLSRPWPKYYPTAPTPEEGWENVRPMWDGHLKTNICLDWPDQSFRADGW